MRSGRWTTKRGPASATGAFILAHRYARCRLAGLPIRPTSYVGIVQSLLASCRLQGTDPYVYLVEVPQRIDTHPAFDVHLLTPAYGSSTSLPILCGLILIGFVNNAEELPLTELDTNHHNH